VVDIDLEVKAIEFLINTNERMEIYMVTTLEQDEEILSNSSNLLSENIQNAIRLRMVDKKILRNSRKLMEKKKDKLQMMKLNCWDENVIIS